MVLLLNKQIIKGKEENSIMPQSPQLKVNNKIVNWIIKNYLSIIVFSFIELIVLLHSSSIWVDTKQNTISSYSLTKVYQECIVSSSESSKCFNVDIHDIQIAVIEFYADIIQGAGDLEWKLKGSNGEYLYSGQLSQNNYADGKYRIEFGEIILKNFDRYQLELALLNDGIIQVYTDADNYIRAVYHYNFQYRRIIMVIIILANIGIAIIIILLLGQVSIYKKYWILAISTGILSVSLVIPLSTPDEFRHFARAYSLAEGNSLCRYDEQGEPYIDIPTDIYNLRYMAPDNVDQRVDETNFTINISRWIYYLKSEDHDDRIEAWMGGVHEKGILEYLPQVIAIKIGMLLGVRQIWLFYWARIGNWIAAVLIWFLSLWMVPKYKLLFVVLYCMPTNIIMACTSSTDGLVNALVMLIMAICIMCYYNHKTLMDKKVLIVLFVVSTYIAIIKLPYMLVMFLFVALDTDLSYSKADWKKIFKLFIIVTGICLLSYCVASFYKNFYVYNNSTSNYTEVFLYMIKHGVETARVLFLQEFLYNFDGYYRQAIAINNFDITVLVLPYSMLMICGGTCERSEKEIKTIQLVIIMLICGVIWAGILLAAYLWTGVGAARLWGVQGRYMCPVIMIGSLFVALNDKLYSRNSVKYIPTFCMFIMIVAFMNIIQIQWV